jgi:hypothetical protein
MKTRTKRHHLKKGRKTFRKKTKGGFWPFSNSQPTTGIAPSSNLPSSAPKQTWWSSLFSQPTTKTPAAIPTQP